MRVVIVDPDLKAGRKLAASVEQLLPTADVLLYGKPDEALTGIGTHSPDVAFVAPNVNGVAGPEFLAKARGITDNPKYVGIVDKPDADASIAWVSAGAKLVVARPVDTLGIRAALRQTAGGIDP
jgi:DNA-binding NarL/FixJ family response regulator